MSIDWRNSFDASVDNSHIEAQISPDSMQEGTLPSIAFNQDDINLMPHACGNHESGKAAPTTNVKPWSRLGSVGVNNFERIFNMTPTKISQTCFGDYVDAWRPFTNQVFKLLKNILCFT